MAHFPVLSLQIEQHTHQCYRSACVFVSVFCTGKIQGGQDHTLQFWGGHANNEAHSDLSWCRPLLRGNSPTSRGLIWKMNECYKGWVECTRSSHGEGGEFILYPYLQGRGPFIDRPGVHKLWFSYFTSWVKLHGQWAPDWKHQFTELWTRMPDWLLCSWASMW
jgi:hypothetical protein